MGEWQTRLKRKTKYTKDILEAAVIKSTNYKELLSFLGLSSSGGAFVYIKKYLYQYEIVPPWLERGKGWSKNKTVKTDLSIKKNRIANSYPDELVFSTKTPATISNKEIKKRLISFGIKEKCCICGIHNWLDKKISLDLDHINGINTDNRLENLRFLCPNCHRQTDSWGKRKKPT